MLAARICAALLHSARAGAALMSGGERETMTGRALTILMRSLRTSLLTGTVVSGMMAAQQSDVQ